jgi:hypothetical protein
MAQHDYVVSNQSFVALRADLNNALAAAVTNNSGPAAPSTTYPFMLWPDTTEGLLKIRNAANNAWIPVGTLDTLNLGLATAASVAAAAPVLGTAQNSTSGTAISFTGIPSYAKRVTLLFSGVSTSTDTGILVQLGVGTTPTTAGYANGYSTIATTFDGNSYLTTATSGVPVYNQAAFTTTGQITFTNITGSTWLASGAFAVSSGISGQITSGGSVALSGPLGMIRATVDAGAFDLGLMNIVIE